MHEMTFQVGAAPRRFEIRQLVIAGWTGRDRDAVSLPVSSVVAPCHPGAARRDLVLVQRERATSSWLRSWSCLLVAQRDRGIDAHRAAGGKVAGE
jgi:hypothetical protein